MVRPGRICGSLDGPSHNLYRRALSFGRSDLYFSRKIDRLFFKYSLPRGSNPQKRTRKESTCCEKITQEVFLYQEEDDYIYFYNHQRIQLKTKLTPFE